MPHEVSQDHKILARTGIARKTRIRLRALDGSHTEEPVRASSSSEARQRGSKQSDLHGRRQHHHSQSSPSKVGTDQGERRGRQG